MRAWHPVAGAALALALALLAAIWAGRGRQVWIDPLDRPCALLDLGYHRDALDAFQDLQAAGHPRAEVGIGLALAGLGRTEEARWCLAGHGDHEQEGLLLYELGRIDEAAYHFGLAVTDDPLSWSNLGMAWDALGLPEAIGLLELAAAAMCPDDAAAHLPLEVLALEEQDQESAARIHQQSEYLEVSNGEEGQSR